MKQVTEVYEVNSLKFVMAKFAEILQAENKLDSLQGNEYWDFNTVFTKQLQMFLAYNFTCLNTRQLLKLCALVSRYRPVQPFSFLVTCSNLIAD